MSTSAIARSPIKSSSSIKLDLKTGKMDEHKAILGTLSETEARSIYTKAFSDGKGAERIGAITAMSVQEFKEWLAKGKTHATCGGRGCGRGAHCAVPARMLQRSRRGSRRFLRIIRGYGAATGLARLAQTHRLLTICRGSPCRFRRPTAVSSPMSTCRPLIWQSMRIRLARRRAQNSPCPIASPARQCQPPRKFTLRKERTEPVKTRPKAVEEQAEKDSGKPDRKPFPRPSPSPRSLTPSSSPRPMGRWKLRAARRLWRRRH